MTCSDLTIICITKGEACCLPLLAKMTQDAQGLGASMLLFLDNNRGDFTPEFYEHGPAYFVLFLVNSGGYVESVLDYAVSKPETRYVLRLDDDERMSPEMISWLASGAYRASDHWKFPRAHLWRDESTFIAAHPLWPDHQTRLSVKEKAGGRTTVHAGSPFGGGRLAPCYIEHHKFLIRSREEREEISARYEKLQPGAGTHFRSFSVPEEVFAPEQVFRGEMPTSSIIWAQSRAEADEAFAAIEPAIDLALDRGAFQHREELVEFCKWMIAELGHRPVNVLEIGTLKGGTAVLWHEISNGKVITVDMPDGRFGGADHGYDVFASLKRSKELHDQYPRIRSVVGDSHNLDTLNLVKEELTTIEYLKWGDISGDAPPLVDLLFIDGDHTLSGVRQDYEMYSPLVRPGGVIAFHDVDDTPMHQRAGCEVPQFFASLSGDKRVFSCGGPWGGIGAIIKSTK